MTAQTTAYRALVILSAAALITAGCDSQNPQPDAGAPPAVSPSDVTEQQSPPDRLTIDVTIKAGEVTPTNAQLQGKVNEPIVVRVNSDAADELHVHSVPEHTFAVEAKPGQSFQFTVEVPGRVDIELHELNRTIATIQVQQ